MGPQWDSSLTSLCCGDATALGLQDAPPPPPKRSRSSRTKTQWVGGSWGVTAWFWAWVIAGLVSLLDLPFPHHQSELSRIALANSPFATMSKALDLFCFHILRVISPTPSGPALLYHPGEI